MLLWIGNICTMSENETYILTINGGSSSVKFALFEHDSLTKVLYGKIDHIGMEDTSLSLTDVSSGKVTEEAVTDADVSTVLMRILEAHIPLHTLSTIGHRVVHGGTRYREPIGITAEVIADLESLAHFAPNHLPAQIALLKMFGEKFGHIPQVACFDTAFYRDLPRMAQIIPVPHKFESQGVRRYGFHGLSYEYLMQHLDAVLHEPIHEKKIILAHLGSGVSLTAVQNGVPVETTMGFTPNSGMPMGTRSGDLEPGVFEYCTQTLGMSPEAFNHLVNFESGIFGISETTPNMEVLLARASSDARAEEAVAYFCYQARKHIGALASVMNGVDILVFTGGMGEQSSEIRRRICTGLEYLGINLNIITNTANSTRIGETSSRVIIYVIPTDEELMIARHTKVSQRGTRQEV